MYQRWNNADMRVKLGWSFHHAEGSSGWNLVLGKGVVTLSESGSERNKAWENKFVAGWNWWESEVKPGWSSL